MEATFNDELFRSFRKDARLSERVTMEDETRLSLVPPVPSNLAFELDVPSDAVLKFATGVSTFGREFMVAPVDFAISVEWGTEAELVFEQTIPRRYPDRWFEHRVDFGPWAGKTVRVHFETRLRGTEYTRPVDRLTTSGQHLLPVWGSPILDGSRDDGNRPLLLLISIDCLRADHVGVFGYPRETTPFIDRFASDGVVFDDTVSVSSWTLPTHMSLLTGLMPSAHGVSRSHKRHPAIPYLPDILSREGYETIGIVSGGYVSQSFGFEEGFDIYSTLYGSTAEEIVDRALEFMGTSRRERFVFLHFYGAHWPYLAPRRFRDRFVPSHLDVSEQTTKELLDKMIQPAPPSGAEEVQFAKDLYDAEIAYIDEQLGRLWESMKQAGLYEDALIVLTADHGEAFYEHERWLHHDLYNEITHIPLIVKWPGRSPSGRVQSMASQLNVFPTILHAAGLGSPYNHESLAELLGEGSEPVQPRRRVLSEVTWEPNEIRGASVQIASREGQLKYIATFEHDREGERIVPRLVAEELYDIALDPREQNNLLSENASATVFRQEVEAFLVEARKQRAGRRGDRVVIDAELERKLKALGYLQP